MHYEGSQWCQHCEQTKFLVDMAIPGWCQCCAQEYEIAICELAELERSSYGKEEIRAGSSIT